MRLPELLNLTGYFWLPGNSEQRLLGMLSVSTAGRTTLELIGVFSDDSEEEFMESPRSRRIVGVVENNEPVTLEGCFYEQKQINPGGFSKCIISVSVFLRGAIYEEANKITFSAFCFSVEGLDEWLSITGISADYNQKTGAASIYFNPPEEIVCRLPHQMSFAFTFGWTSPNSPMLTEVGIKQKAYIALRSDDARPIEDFLALAFKVNNLLCFAIDEKVFIDSAICYARDIAIKSAEHTSREVSIELYCQMSPFSENRTTAHFRDMLFSHRQIAERFEEILNNWLLNYDTSEPAFNLYFSSRSGAYKYLEGRFLSLAQGIETLHRRNSDSTMMPEDEFHDLIESLLQGCPPTWKNWLTKKLEYANELPLRSRLRQMIEPFKSLYGDSRERLLFIDNVIDTRNYLTHYDPRLALQVARGQSLWNLCMKLEALFQLHLLRLIGLEGAFITNLVSKNRALCSKLGRDK